MALALYRKYRPRTFAEVIGQEHVTEPLMQALRSGRLNHAYLFSGPRGCGKTSSARILARSLNCAKGPTPEPCGECDSCVALAPDGPGSIDVIEIDAASHGGVDDARELRERAFFAPVASRFKVYVIDEAHMVSTQGFNALLKLVEEPPEYVKFIFATTEPEKVLGTIRSRTHHYPFRLMPPSVLRPYLEKLCQQEGVSVEPTVFPLVVRAGGGSARDSLSILDQLIAGAGVYGVTYARAVALLGVTDVALIDEMTDALAAVDGAAAFATIDRVADAGHDPRRFASDLLERLRDLIVLQRVPDAVESGIIDAPDDQLERMSTQASRMGQATLSRLADIAHSGLTEMRGTTAPRLLLELIVARMLLPGADDSQSALLQRLERMERRLGASSTVDSTGTEPPIAATPVSRPEPASRPPAPAKAEFPKAEFPKAEFPKAEPPKADPARPAPAVAAAPETKAAAEPVAEVAPVTGPPGSLDAAAVRRVWDEVLTVVRRRSARSAALIREATVRDVHGDEVVLTFQHAAHANMFPAQAELLGEALREILGGTWRVRAELAGEAGAAAPSGPRAAAPAPAPARPQRDAAPAPAPPQRATTQRADDGGWPETARPGGVDAPPAPARPAEQPPERVAEPAPAKSAGAARAKAVARSAAAKSAPAKGRGAPAARGRESGPPPPDEPPFDPDYDAPPPGRAMYDGFDPGDEPLDDANAVRETSEEQAKRALSAQFIVEKIGESNPRP
jgi:DNA polymerase III subunit gamma/tau